jgi:toxin YoeB
LEFERKGFEDLAWWVPHDRSKARKIMRLILDTAADPFKGIGKPEPLKHELAGCWSRRIDEEHRLIYKVFEDRIRILACRYHY